MSDIFSRWALSALPEFADGNWQDLAREVVDCGVFAWFWLVMRVALAVEEGWLQERDETWFRLTPAGREMLESAAGQDAMRRWSEA